MVIILTCVLIGLISMSKHDLFLHIVHYSVAVVTSIHRSSTCINEMGHFYIFLSSMNCKFYTSSVHKYIKLDNR